MTSTSARTSSGAESGAAAYAAAHFVNFTVDDEVILQAFCSQLRATIRSLITDALLARVDVKDTAAQGLLDFYTDRSKANSPAIRFSAQWSLQRNPVQYVWPQKDILSSTHSKLAALSDRYFNVFKYDEDELMGFVVNVFQELSLLEQFKIPLQTLQNFVMAAKARYRANPFHNWYHGFSVFQFSYWTLRNTDARSFLTDSDVLVLLAASLCHDIDHPGRTNSFEINSQSELALRYNDISVLENHHAMTTFLILRDPQCNLFAHVQTQPQAQPPLAATSTPAAAAGSVPPYTWQQFRAAIVEAILATDMTAHFEACRKLGSRERVHDADVPFDRAVQKERQSLVNIVIHAADLSSQAYPTAIASLWEAKISAEFQDQADEEEKKKLPVAPFMQGLADPAQRYLLQVKFIDFILTPWWNNLARVFPAYKVCFRTLLRNRKYYECLSSGREVDTVESDSETENDDSKTAVSTSGGQPYSSASAAASAVK